MQCAPLSRLWLWAALIVLGGTAAEPTPGLDDLITTPSILDRSPVDLARQLGLYQESRTANSTAWKSGPRKAFGTSVAGVRLFAENDRVTKLVINVLNKGDFFAPVRVAEQARTSGVRPPGPGESVTGRLKRQMEREFEATYRARLDRLMQGLTHRFAAPPARETVMIETKRRRVLVWRTRLTAILLDEEPHEYLLLSVRPLDALTTQVRRTSDRTVAQRLEKNVLHRPNGDVLVRNIPRVDQGEKGYCGVAAAERMLRYFGIAASEDRLAKTTGTDKFGGTTWNALIRSLRRLAARSHRTLVVHSGKLTFNRLASALDKGLPVLWAMEITSEMEKTATERLNRRPITGDMSAWKFFLKQDRRRTRRIRRDPDGGHIRLIVGYNRATDEIAFSDTWARMPVRWLTLDEANQVHGNQWAVLRP